MRTAHFISILALLLSLAFSQSIQLSDSAASAASGLAASASSSGIAKASVYFGGKGEGLAQYAIANSSNKTGEPSFSYRSTYDPSATVSIGYGKDGAYLKVGYSGNTPVSNSQVSKVVSSELTSLSSKGAIKGISAGEISEIKDLVSKGSGYVVYSGPSEASEIPGLPSDAISLPSVPSGQEATAGSGPSSQAPTDSPASETSGQPQEQPEVQPQESPQPTEQITRTISEILQNLGEKNKNVFYHLKEGGNWVGVETEKGGNSADQQQAEATKTISESPSLFFSMASIFSAIAIGIVIFGAFALIAYQLFFRPPAIDYEIYKALSNETRISILQELYEVEKIPTDISRKLEKSKATISEHLDRLLEAGLVEKVEQAGKKFVFYRITQKGKSALRQKAA